MAHGDDGNDEPARRKTRGSGTTRVIYTDTHGNEISFGSFLT
jgi:hypothetical protein